jgi:ankyrin repeat protein
MTDCSICYDEITVTTGRSVMSCGHEFHLGCIARWLQKPDGPGNCPCCRANPSEKERIVAAAESESESEEEEEEEMDGTPLMDAVMQNDIEQVRFLLDTGGVNVNDADSEGDTALCYAVLDGASDQDESETVTAALLTRGADLLRIARLYAPDEVATYNNVLMAAVIHDSRLCARHALMCGADPNYASASHGGRTPLMEAVRSGKNSARMVNLLVSNGANVFAVDAEGWNVFMWFVQNCDDVDVMAELLTALGPIAHPRALGAAKKIQAVWRGHRVRKTVAIARVLVTIHLTVTVPGLSTST